VTALTSGRNPNESSGPASGHRAGDAGTVNVVFERSGTTLPWDPEAESILELAEDHGLLPDHRCRAGICHTCKCRLIAGEVVYPIEPAEHPEPGYALICCSRPAGDIAIDL
jgi:ferredoxin